MKVKSLVTIAAPAMPKRQMNIAKQVVQISPWSDWQRANDSYVELGYST